jgi:adenylyltransferase/sulfurtransferase
MLLPQIGETGQKHLQQSSVVITGCGALGTATASHLARAGVGKITIVDRDIIELHNLQRQTLFDDEDVTKRLPKAVAAVEKLKKINPTLALESEICHIFEGNIETLIQGFDLVIDGLDNMDARLIVNDACQRLGIPWIFGSAVSSFGMTMNIIPGTTPCLRCLMEEIPAPSSLPTSDTVGILNTVPAIISALQSTEAIKILINSCDVANTLIYIDVWKRIFNKMNISIKEGCPGCAKKGNGLQERTVLPEAIPLHGRNAVQIVRETENPVSLHALVEKFEKEETFFANNYLVSFAIGSHEVILFVDGRVLVKGTEDPSTALELYNTYLTP